MKLVCFVLAAITLALIIVIAKNNIIINPTGTYQLKAKTISKNGETYGYSGKIQIKQIKTDSIIMSFYVNKGAPSYNSGSFIDTLYYYNNCAYYTEVEFDDSCKITFTFDKKGIHVEEESTPAQFNCGFGWGVDVNGYFKKNDNKVPLIKDLLIEE